MLNVSFSILHSSQYFVVQKFGGVYLDVDSVGLSSSVRWLPALEEADVVGVVSEWEDESVSVCSIGPVRAGNRLLSACSGRVEQSLDSYWHGVWRPLHVLICLYPFRWTHFSRMLSETLDSLLASAAERPRVRSVVHGAVGGRRTRTADRTRAPAGRARTAHRAAEAAALALHVPRDRSALLPRKSGARAAARAARAAARVRRSARRAAPLRALEVPPRAPFLPTRFNWHTLGLVAGAAASGSVRSRRRRLALPCLEHA